MKTLNSISLFYASVMVVIGVMLIMGKSAIEQTEIVEYIYFGVILLHAIMQFAYSYSMRSKLSLTSYQKIETLDNELGYSDDFNVEVVENSEWMIVCAGVASFVELVMSWVFLRQVFRLNFGPVTNALELAEFLLVIVGALFSGIVLFHNLRTWKLKWIVAGKDF